MTIQGNRHCIFAVAVVLFALSTTEFASAQTGRLRSRSGARQVTHNLKAEPHAFDPVRWDIQNRFRNGCVVEWRVVPFAHESAPAAVADCDLTVRLVQFNRRARWRVATPNDSTSVATGKNAATVSMTAAAPGNARAELVLRFNTSNVTSLAAGDYETTVVGTITGI